MKKIFITNYFSQMKKLSTISYFINLELQNNSYIYEFSNFSLSLVNSLSIRSKLTGFLLLKSLLRFGDLFNINLKEAISARHLSIYQNKTGKYISIPFVIENEDLQFQLATFDNFHETINYHILKNEILRFTRKYPLFNNIDWKHSAHIFRHVESSFMFSRDIPINFIARRLGDEEKTVQSNYIHKELLTFFTQ
jgi:hypothetical protein